MKHVDVGEKIGGARKDWYKSPMKKGEIEGMSNVEIDILVRKDKVWPAINWRAKREAGMTPQCANLLKYVRDSIPVVPAWENAEHYYPKETAKGKTAENYVRTVGLIRDAADNDRVKTEKELLAALTNVFENMQGIAVIEDPERVEKPRRPGAARSSDPTELICCMKTKLPVEYSLGRSFDAKIYRPIAESAVRVTQEAIIDAKATSSAYREGIRTPEVLPWGIRRAIGRRVSNFDESQKADSLTEDRLWAFAIKPGRLRSEEEKAAQQAAREDNLILHRPHLNGVKTEGARRSPNRNVEAGELMKEFGFRAVEFGNWLPDDERQDVLNFAYDAFDQLAQVLDVPRQAISLGGRLAVAFGSRGHGGPLAALAHFEPLRNVINLTRLGGAGCLAHEWMHAFDFSQGWKASKDMTYRMEHDMRDAHDMQLESTKELDQTIEKIAETIAPEAGEKEQISRRLKSRAAEALGMLSEAVKPLAADAAQHAGGRLDSFAEETVRRASVRAGKLVAGDAVIVLDVEKSKGFRTVPEADYVLSGSETLLRDAFEKYGKAEILIQSGRGSEIVENRGESLFYKHAKALDRNQNRREAYWADPKELFARAGACSVSDLIEQQNMRNDYLVYGAKEGTHEDRAADPNTRGADRKRLNQAFSRMFGQWRDKIRETVQDRPPLVESAAQTAAKQTIQSPENGYDLRLEMRTRMEEARMHPDEIRAAIQLAAQRLQVVTPRKLNEAAQKYAGLMTAPAVLSVRESRAHDGKAVLQVYDDADLAFGGMVTYQLFDIKEVKDVVIDGRLIVHGPCISAATIDNGQEKLAGEDDLEPISITSRKELEVVIQSAERNRFIPCLNEDVVSALGKSLEERQEEIKENIRKARAMSGEKRGRRSAKRW